MTKRRKTPNTLKIYFPDKFMVFLEKRKNKSKTIQNALMKCHGEEIGEDEEEDN